MCGSATVEWERFVETLLKHDVADEGFSFDEFSQFVPVRQSAVTSMLRLCSQRMPTSLWMLLQVTSHLHCYEPRDKVYALLSIAKTGALGIDADYAMPLPQLMNLVLSNLHLSNPPWTVHQIAIQCKRLKSMMGLKPDFPWGASDYLATADPESVAAVQAASDSKPVRVQ